MSSRPLHLASVWPDHCVVVAVSHFCMLAFSFLDSRVALSWCAFELAPACVVKFVRVSCVCSRFILLSLLWQLCVRSCTALSRGHRIVHRARRPVLRCLCSMLAFGVIDAAQSCRALIASAV